MRLWYVLPIMQKNILNLKANPQTYFIILFVIKYIKEDRENEIVTGIQKFNHVHRVNTKPLYA